MVTNRTLATLWLAAVFVYVPLVGWGLPHATTADRIKTYATDEILPLEGLAEMRSTFISPAPDRNVSYPWWHYFVVSVAQAPYLAALRVSGDFSTPDSAYPFGLRDPVRALEVLTITGRLVTVFMAAGIVVASFLFASTLGGRTTGLVAAILTMLSFPMFYYGRTGNLDVPAFFWSAIGLVIVARMLVDGVSIKRAAWLGCFAALAVATKDQAVVLFLPGCLVPFFLRSGRTAEGRLPFKGLAALVMAGVGAYVLATGMWIDPGRHLAHVDALLFNQHRVSSASIYFPPASMTLGGTWDLFAGTVGGLAAWWTWPALLLAGAGLMGAIHRDKRHLMWVLPVVATFVLFVRLPGGVVLRYFLPMTLLVDAFAALALVRLGASQPTLFKIGFGVLIAWRLAMGLDLSYAQWNETRYSAGAWLQANARAGDRIEYFGVADTLPPLGPELPARRVMGRERWVGETGHGAAVLNYLAREGPRFVIVIPDWTSGRLERSADCPPEVYAALSDGSAGYRLMAFFQTPSLIPAPFRRPRLDNPSVAPPVRIFVRGEPPGSGR